MKLSLQDGPILPPRPNPGPEPWADSQPWPIGLLFGITLVMFTLLIPLAIFLWSRSRRRRSRSSQLANALEAARLSPKSQMIAWSAAIRSALVDRFGPTWGARTTEEIARAPELLDRLGPEPARQLARFLAEADLAKFADDSENDYHPEAWSAWVAEFLAGPGDRASSRAGANSTTKGK